MKIRAVQGNDIIQSWHDAGPQVHMAETKIGRMNLAGWRGVDTGPKEKERLVYDMQVAMRFDQVSILQSSQFTSITFKNAEHYRDTLCDQFANFGWIAKDTNRADGNYKIVHTGKRAGGTDDSVMAFGLALTWSLKSLQSSKYNEQIRFQQQAYSM